jgi:Protein kinase domain
MDGGGTTGVPVIPGLSGLVEVGHTPAAMTYRAHDDATGANVVLKVLQRDASPEVRARFDYDQARLAELLEHPDIVNTVAHGYTADNRPYLVMEELGGGSMAERVGSGMDGPGVLAIGIKIAGALESAHRRNLIHGDLRPEDILVTDDGEPHIADLGVALVTGLGPDRATDPGRVAHAAPEQLETHVPTTSSDVFALGSVLYTLLAGRPAFVQPGDTTATAVVLRIANDPPPDLRATGVPDAVIDVIDRAMAKDPAKRWESAEAMGHALQQAEVTLGLPITPMHVIGTDLTTARPRAEDADAADAAPPPSPGGGEAKQKKSRLPLLVGAALVVVAVAVATVLVLGGGDDDADDDDATGFTRPDVEELDLREVSDDSDTITLGAIERWDEVDGRPIDTDPPSPDVVVAEDPATFFEGGFDVSGVEVTFHSSDALASEGLDADAEAILVDRVTERALDDQCVTENDGIDITVAGFSGQLVRFDDCDGTSIEVFAGIDGGDALLVEAHLVDDEDEAAIEQVLESITIA